MNVLDEIPFFLLDYLSGRMLDFFDVRMQHTTSTKIQMTDEVIDQVSQDDVAGIGVRVLKNGVWGFSSTTSQSKNDLLAACERAVKASKGSKPRKLNFTTMKTIKEKRIDHPKINPIDVPPEDKISAINDYQKVMKSFDPRIKSAQVRYMDSIDEVAVHNSDGSSVVFSQPFINIGFNVISNEGSKTQHARGRASSACGYEFTEGPKVDYAALDAACRAIDLLAANDAPSGRGTVIMDPSVAGLFLHEAFGHSAEADTVLQGRSFLMNKIGDRIASPLVNVVSDATLPGSPGSYAFDSEAVPATKTKLIDEGVFKSYMHSRETACMFGVQPTSNGRAEDYSKPPIVRMNNLYFSPGDSSFEEIVENTREGVLARCGGGGLEDPEKGRFQFSVQNCYKIVNGEVGAPMNGTSLSGSTLETMLSIDMLGREFEVDFGSCGKGEPLMQIVPVINGGPYIRLKNVLLGG